VRELQHRLRQLEWYSGSITGTYGRGTAAGVRGFQRKRGLDDSGRLDRKTWDTLVSMTKAPSRDDLHNVLRPGPAQLKRGSDGDRVRSLQARLKQIGWFSGRVTGSYSSATVSAVKGFQGKRGIPVTGEVDARTWSRLTAMTRTPSHDEKHNIVPKPSAAGLDPRCLTGRALCVSKRTDKLVWVIDGKPQLRVDVRFGSAELPTRNGSFKVGWKSRHHVSSLYHTPMPYAMFFSGGQAVHYSRDFAARGYAGASHGCVNVRNLGAIKRLFDTVRVGDKVIVYR
jgi:peptidoglycan hydrolase-like protein with peptidoglycan-binding domain